jgi:hypothetical protein
MAKPEGYLVQFLYLPASFPELAADGRDRYPTAIADTFACRAGVARAGNPPAITHLLK